VKIGMPLPKNTWSAVILTRTKRPSQTNQHINPK